jgi:ribose-phosphate pyrophosphokinase
MPRSHEYKLFSGSAHPELAQKIANELDKPLGAIERKTFPCGEQYVSLGETVRDQIAFLIQPTREEHVDKDYMQLFLMSNAAINAFSKKRVAIIPHYGYARQERIDKLRSPISAKLIAKLIEASGIDHLITCQLHCEAIVGFFDIPVDHIILTDLIANHIKNMGLEDLMVVSTDAGGVKNAKQLAKLLKADLAILHKEHIDDHTEVTHVVGDVKGKTCLVHDDIGDSFGSMKNAKKALIENGANPDVYASLIHPVFSKKAEENIRESRFKKIVVTDTLPLGPKKQFENVEVVSAARVIAERVGKIVRTPLSPTQI